MAEKVYVEALVLKVIDNAYGARKYAVDDRRAMYFDFDKPAAYVATPGRNEPTVFPSKEEAERRITDFLARVRGAIRASQRPGRITAAPPTRKYGFGPVAAPAPKPLEIGSATLLFGHPGVVGGEGAHDLHGEPIPGYRFVAYSEWETARAEEQRFDHDDASAELAEADLAVQQAQERADGLRGEIKPVAPRPTAGTSKWVAAGHKVQVYRREDGTESYRGRSDGKVSPSFDTLEQATAWVEGDREPEKPSDGRAEAMEAMRDRVVRT